MPVSTIAVLDPGKKKPNKWPIIKDESENFEIILEPYENVENSLVFGVTVFNQGQEKMLIDPAKWSMYSQRWSEDQRLIKERFSILSSDSIASLYESQIVRLEQLEKTKKTILITTSVILIVGTVAILANQDHSADVAERSDEVVYYSDQGMIGVSFYDGLDRGASKKKMSNKEKIAFAHEMNEKYRNSEIMPTILSSGEEIYFEVYFHRVEGLRAFQLNWELSNKALEWQFVHSTR
jgi:hypothetical protein